MNYDALLAGFIVGTLVTVMYVFYKGGRIG